MLWVGGFSTPIELLYNPQFTLGFLSLTSEQWFLAILHSWILYSLILHFFGCCGWDLRVTRVVLGRLAWAHSQKNIIGSEVLISRMLSTSPGSTVFLLPPFKEVSFSFHFLGFTYIKRLVSTWQLSIVSLCIHLYPVNQGFSTSAAKGAQVGHQYPKYNLKWNHFSFVFVVLKV